MKETKVLYFFSLRAASAANNFYYQKWNNNDFPTSGPYQRVGKTMYIPIIQNYSS